MARTGKSNNLLDKRTGMEELHYQHWMDKGVGFHRQLLDDGDGVNRQFKSGGAGHSRIEEPYAVTSKYTHNEGILIGEPDFHYPEEENRFQKSDLCGDLFTRGDDLEVNLSNSVSPDDLQDRRRDSRKRSRGRTDSWAHIREHVAKGIAEINQRAAKDIKELVAKGIAEINYRATRYIEEINHRAAKDIAEANQRAAMDNVETNQHAAKDTMKINQSALAEINELKAEFSDETFQDES